MSRGTSELQRFRAIRVARAVRPRQAGVVVNATPPVGVVDVVEGPTPVGDSRGQAGLLKPQGTAGRGAGVRNAVQDSKVSARDALDGACDG